MKTLFALTACILVISSQVDADSERLLATKFDHTALCYPASYSPVTSFMDAFLAPIEDQLDSSEGQELIYIPAERIKELVPAYTESHINSYGVNFAHDLRGIAYSLSSIGNPTGLAEKAWNVRAGSESYFVEPDPELPYFRIYPYPEPLFMWDLVKSPPPEDPSGSPPDDWYMGRCLEMAGGFDCRQTAIFESVYYEYMLDQRDLTLRDAVREAAILLMSQWRNNCKRE